MPERAASGSGPIARREFCRMIGCAAIVGCAGPLAGCARALEWSERLHAEPVDVDRLRGSSVTTAAVETTEATAAVPARPEPDLTVRTGPDPAANLASAIAALGGWERFVKPGARVVVKPNVVTAREPQYAACTDPDLVEAIVRAAYEAGAASVVVLDRPTAPARSAFEVSGILAATERAGGTVKFLTDRNLERVTIPGGQAITEWPLVIDALEADTLINVPIAKEHGLARLTMAMKNLMGVMGDPRGQIHRDFPTKIVDLALAVRPHLTILDARRILTANGPLGGRLQDVAQLDTLIAGTNMASVDAYGTTLFGMQPTDLAYLVQAAERGIGEIELDALVIDRAAT